MVKPLVYCRGNSDQQLLFQDNKLILEFGSIFMRNYVKRSYFQVFLLDRSNLGQVLH